MTIACERNGKELIAVVTGFKTSKARNDFVTKLLDWGYGRLASMETASGKIVDNDSIPK